MLALVLTEAAKTGKWAVIGRSWKWNKPNEQLDKDNMVVCLPKGYSSFEKAPFATSDDDEQYEGIGVTCCKDSGKTKKSKDDKCGQDGQDECKGFRPCCNLQANYQDANKQCRNSGMRLCTKAELLDSAGAVRGCHGDKHLHWSSTSCDPDAPSDGDEEDDGFDCDTSNNFITGGGYGQQDLGRGITEDEALEKCKEICKAQKCQAFFYQVHGCGGGCGDGKGKFKICGTYRNVRGQPVRHGHGGKSQVCKASLPEAGEGCPKPAPFSGRENYPGSSRDKYYNYCNYMVTAKCGEMCKNPSERGRCRNECDKYGH